MWLLILVGLVALIVGIFYRKFQKSGVHWERKNIPYFKSSSILEHYLLKPTKSFTELSKEIYDADPNSRYVGTCFFNDPALMIKDPELLKDVMIKSFDHFMDHPTFIPEEADTLWSKNLFASTGETWRNLRSILSPSFTGSKMRYLFTLLEECSKGFVRYFNSQNKEEFELELKDIFSKYTNDVIASSAFGLKCDSLKDPKNEFYTNGLQISRVFSTWRVWLHVIFPKIGKMLKFRIFTTSVYTFFTTIIETTIKTRKKENIVRPDMLQLLMQVSGDTKEENEDHEQQQVASKPTKNKTLTTEDICAQAFIFFLGGFDTVSTGLSFVAYELAVNQDVQERLFEEIKSMNAQSSDGLTYESLLKMKYLDMVVSESFRKWPPFPLLDREVTKKFVIEPKLPHEQAVVLEKGDKVWLPIYGIQMSSKHFANPEKFDPERFNDENKESIIPFTYMPFGNGPRNCIGSRFALLEIKLLVFYVLLNFKIIPTEKSVIPVVLDKVASSLTAKSLNFAFKKQTNA